MLATEADQETYRLARARLLTVDDVYHSSPYKEWKTCMLMKCFCVCPLASWRSTDELETVKDVK